MERGPAGGDAEDEEGEQSGGREVGAAGETDGGRWAPGARRTHERQNRTAPSGAQLRASTNARHAPPSANT